MDKGNSRQESGADAAFCNAQAYQAVLAPVKGKEPKAPALTLPEILSPSTLPANSRVIGMGEVILADQLNLFPSTLPFATGWVAPCAVWVPLRAAPSFFSSSTAFCAPIGELIVFSHFPSMAMRVSQMKRPHLRGAARRP